MIFFSTQNIQILLWLICTYTNMFKVVVVYVFDKISLKPGLWVAESS